MRRCSRSALLLCAIAGSLSGCTGSVRRDAGTGIAAVGGLTMLGGAGVAAGCAAFDDDDDPNTSSCENDGLEPNPEVGLPVIGLGLAIAIIGGVVYGTGVDMTPPKPPPSETQESESESEYLY